MPRGAHQANASRASEAKSSGAKVYAGKAKSAQTANAHGLTGKINLSNAERQFIHRLTAALKELYSAIDPDKSTRLIDIILTSQIRVHRAYELIEDRVTYKGTPQSPLVQRQAATAERILEVQTLLIAMTGDKNWVSLSPG